jgi:uncharacterized membrane protein YdjX (TVP38/TMEM64 family)
MADPADTPATQDGARTRLARAAPLALLLGLGAAALWAAGDFLSFETLARHRAALEAWRDAHYAAAALAFVGVYVAAVALSIPGAIWLTLAGGLLFGTAVGAALVAVAATTGATILFLAARAGLGEGLRRRAGGWLSRLGEGVRENEAAFMLTLRLVPAVPFFVANLAPAFLGVRPVTYVWTTFVGILPATVVFASVGAGLGAVIDRGERPDLGALSEPAVLGPLLGLAALAALPAVVRALRRRR